MNETTPHKRSILPALLAGAMGGLLVLVLGAVLIATDTIDTGKTETRIVREGIPSRPVADTGDSNDTRSVSEIYEQEGAGVVFVSAKRVSQSNSPFGSPGDGNGQATGSGFVVDKQGTIITNAHVVDGAEEVEVRFGEDDEFVAADVVGSDLSTDLAVLKVDPKDAKLKPLPLGDSSKAQVGDPVVAIGNPFGYTRSVTTGIVSAKQREIIAPNGFRINDVIQTDASINPGNSGGPLLDAQGRVIGINSQIATNGTSAGSVGIGFAVPINTAKKLLPSLREGKEIERAWFGIEMVAITPDAARDLNLESERGVLIQRVERDGPADKAGLRAGSTGTAGGELVAGGDLIVKIGDQKIDGTDDVATALSKLEPGDKVTVEYYRGDDRKTASVTLGKRPPSSGQANEEFPDGP